MFQSASRELNRLIVVVAIIGSSHGTARSQLNTKHRWESDPALNVEWSYVESTPSQSINLAVFNDGAVNDQLQAAREIVRLASQPISNRHKTFEACLRLLETRLSQQPGNRQLELALLSAALATADDQTQLSQVWKVVVAQPALARVAEPKMVDLQCADALDTWLERLRRVRILPTDAILNAIEGVAACGDESNAELLRPWVENPGISLPIRIAAAKALGGLVSSELDTLAEQILDSAENRSRLLAAHLLARHTDSRSAKLQKKILLSDDQSAQSIAFRALARSFPQEASSLAKQMLERGNSNTRRAVIEALNTSQDLEILKLQAFALADPDVGIRMLATRNFVARLQDPSQSQQIAPVIDEVIQYYLASENWQGIEQAITLVAARRDSRQLPTLVQLLDHPQDAVKIRAAWALQFLQLGQPMLASLHERVQADTEALAQGTGIGRPRELQTAYIFQAFGRQKYDAALDTLQAYIPKNSQKLKPTIRASAIYAIGHILEGTREQSRQLAKQLAARMLDTRVTNPENIAVQYTCAVALGRIGDESVAEALKEVENPPVDVAAKWSLTRLGVLQP